MKKWLGIAMLILSVGAAYLILRLYIGISLDIKYQAVDEADIPGLQNAGLVLIGYVGLVIVTLLIFMRGNTK